MPRFARNTILVALLGAIVVAGAFSGRLFKGWAANRGTIVVFDANWCASCRELTPVVRDVASQNGLGVTQIDIDFQDAPKQARSLGLNIPNDEPPQVFFVDRGKATLIFSGRQYRFGQPEQARATILQNLQRVLQSGASGN